MKIYVRFMKIYVLYTRAQKVSTVLIEKVG